MRGSFYILMMIILNTFQLYNLPPQFSLLNEIITIDLISFGAFLSANRRGGNRAEWSDQSNTQYQQRSSNREKDYMRVILEVPEVDSFSSWNMVAESKVNFLEEFLCDKRTYPRCEESCCFINIAEAWLAIQVMPGVLEWSWKLSNKYSDEKVSNWIAIRLDRLQLHSHCQPHLHLHPTPFLWSSWSILCKFWERL